MFEYPISLPWPRSKRIKHIHPSIAREYHKKIEDYINEVAKESPVTVLNYSEIADATGYDKELVTLCLKPLTASYGGITIVNPSLKDETSGG